MIRPITKEDIKESVNVIRTSFLTVAEEFGLTEENAPRFTAFATTEERLMYQMKVEKRPMYAFFSDEGKMLGYYSLAKLSDTEWELNNLCVLPEHRHEGIGDKLLIDAFARAKELGAKKLHIGIVEENVRLRKWYESEGFIHLGAKKFDFFPFTCGYMEKEL
ncbi:MAG: GNAT family N-acetyltransferase [Clostridiales bacterium]|nr:GNAT family N-acetyltransferase [Clostridiales bacterium]